MAGKMAAIPGVDVIDLQAQSLETTPGTYESFVEQASAQAKKANSSIVVLAGLSTSPNSSTSPTAGELEQDASAVQPYVSGFWMNIPDGDNAMAEAVMIANVPLKAPATPAGEGGARPTRAWASSRALPSLREISSDLWWQVWLPRRSGRPPADARGRGARCPL
jgi:hypothetical protein